MKITSRVLIVCRRTQRCLLWRKVKSGLLTAPGGTQDPPDASIHHTISREVREETKIRQNPAHFAKRGFVRIYEWHEEKEYRLAKIVYLFILEVDSLKIKTPDTKEMIQARWYQFHRLPLKQMSPYYHVWAEHLISGNLICRDVFIDTDRNLRCCYDVEPDQEASAEAIPKKKKT